MAAHSRTIASKDEIDEPGRARVNDARVGDAETG
jgi:hypothetical protein